MASEADSDTAPVLENDKKGSPADLDDDPPISIAPLPWWARFSEPRQRLWAELKRTEAEMPSKPTPASSNGQIPDVAVPMSDYCRTKVGRRLLKAADGALRSGHREAAWALSQDARRALVVLLTPKQQQVLAISTRHLAEDKLAKSARGKSVLELLEIGKVPMPDALIEALLQIDIKSGNQARNDRTIRHELFLLMGVLLTTTIAALLYMYFLGTGDRVTFGNRHLLVLAPLFGILGASISSIQRVARRPTMKVPQQRAAMVANAIRLGTGAGASLVVLAGLQTATRGTTVAAALLGSFAGGFSERFILKFLPDAEPDAEKPSDSTPPQTAAAASKSR
jgi:hypothetical protein